MKPYPAFQQASAHCPQQLPEHRVMWPSLTYACVDEGATKVGYEVSFKRYFYKVQQMRNMEAVRKDIIAMENDTAGLLNETVGL